MTTTTYPNGTALVSDALTLDELQAFLQQLTLAMLGETVSASSDKVRITYPTEGAPFQLAGEDFCYLMALPEDDPYTRIREHSITANNPTTVTTRWAYTKGWKIRWILYGPNSADRCRAIKSALYQEYFTDQLAVEQLFPVPDFKEPVRLPEEIDGQWFERCDFECLMYEFVTETIDLQTVLSSEVIVENKDGVVADITVT